MVDFMRKHLNFSFIYFELRFALLLLLLFFFICFFVSVLGTYMKELRVNFCLCNQGLTQVG